VHDTPEITICDRKAVDDMGDTDLVYRGQARFTIDLKRLKEQLDSLVRRANGGFRKQTSKDYGGVTVYTRM